MSFSRSALSFLFSRKYDQWHLHTVMYFKHLLFLKAVGFSPWGFGYLYTAVLWFFLFFFFFCWRCSPSSGKWGSSGKEILFAKWESIAHNICDIHNVMNVQPALTSAFCILDGDANQRSAMSTQKHDYIRIIFIISVTNMHSRLF